MGGGIGILIWVFVAALVGFVGLNKKGGFWKAFLIGLFFSPLIGVMFVMGLGQKKSTWL